MNFNTYPLISDSWDEEEINAINRVIGSNRYSMGPEVQEFERRFAEKFESRFAVCVNSGSSANLVALAALRFMGDPLRPGDEVIVPTVGWSTTYSPLFYLGATPIFVDINPRSFNLDVAKIEPKITSKTKAILAVNLLGKSSELRALRCLAEAHGLYLIEDNCESMGSRHSDLLAGTAGIAGTFSFFFSHHIATIEGGMIITNSQELRDICVCLRAHGWLRDLDKSSSLYDTTVDEFRRMFWFVLPGFNVRPTEFTGSIGLEQLRKFDKMLSVRKKNYEHFISLIKRRDWLYTQEYDEGHSAFSFPIVLREAAPGMRNSLVRHLADHRIETRPIGSGDITRNPMIVNWIGENAEPIESFPVARYIDENGFMVGNHPADIRASIDHLFSIIDKFRDKIDHCK